MNATPWPYAALGFFVGSIPFGVLVGRAFFRRDLRSEGSGNIGAANALRALGPKAALAVLLLDACKGAGAVLAATNGLFFATPHRGAPLLGIAAAAGLGAIVGHCYSPWLRFRGGKGVATFLGASFALSWKAGIAFVIVWLACVLPTGFSSLGSLCGTFVAAAILVLQYGVRGKWNTAAYGVLSVALIAWRHRENIQRLIHGTETRLPLVRGTSRFTTD